MDSPTLPPMTVRRAGIDLGRFPLVPLFAIFLIGLFLTLTACAGRTLPPAIADKVVQADMPIPVKCIDRASIPAPVPPTAINGDAKHDSSTMAKTILALRSWVDQAMALIGPCVVPPKPVASPPPHGPHP